MMIQQPLPYIAFALCLKQLTTPPSSKFQPFLATFLRRINSQRHHSKERNHIDIPLTPPPVGYDRHSPITIFQIPS